MDNTIIQQGRFTSDGTSENIEIRSDVDWMEVINETQWATTQTTGRGVKFQWQRGMTAGHAFEVTKEDSTNVMQAEKVTVGGFTLLPESPSALVTGTTITKADPAVCTANGHGFSNGDLVVLTTLSVMPQLGGAALFTIGSVATNTFELSFFDTNTANFTQETNFFVRKFPEFAFKPAVNWISDITTGATTAVRLTASAPHLNYEVGGLMKFNIPAAYGMPEINGLSGEITAYDSTTNIYTVAIDSTTFTAFAWPAPGAFPAGVPVVTSVGNNSTSLVDVTQNLAIEGIQLGSGIDGPAGSTSDVIYWRAGKSFSVSN